MKRFLLFIFILGIIPGLKAQEYEKAIGIRGGLSSGFEYRVFTNANSSYKVLLSTRDRGLQIVGLKEYHEYGLFDFSENLNLVYGFGLHVGYEQWDELKHFDTYQIWEDRTAPIVGLDGLVGVEYNFWEVPLSIGLEAKPFFDVLGHKFFRVQPFDIAFTLKYTF